MLLLQIDEKWRFTSDKYNFILQKYEDVIDRKTKEPTGEKEWKDMGYFGGNLKVALKKFSNEYIRDQDKLYIDELITKLEEIENKIDRVVKQENIKLVGKGEEQMEILFEHPWWTTFWLIIVSEGIGNIGRRLKKDD